MVDASRLAEEREAEAAKLTDAQIWKEIVKNVISMSVETEMMVDILLQSIPDIGTIFGQLKYFNKNNMLEDDTYKELLDICIEKLKGKNIDFDPLAYTED